MITSIAQRSELTFSAGSHDIVLSEQDTHVVCTLSQYADVTATLVYSGPGDINHTFICCASSKLTVTIIMLSGASCSYTVDLQLVGADAQAHIVCLYAAYGRARVAISSRQQHNAVRTQSVVHAKGIVGGAAESDYHGTIVVPERMQQITADQQNKVLLYGSQSRARAVPTLEVLADDVRCVHGSAIGMLNELQLWYAQARGMARAQAQALLLTGFLADAVPEAHGAELARAVAQIVEGIDA